MVMGLNCAGECTCTLAAVHPRDAACTGAKRGVFKPHVASQYLAADAILSEAAEVQQLQLLDEPIGGKGVC
jgi:hypothetical protein